MKKFTSFVFVMFVCLGINAQKTFFSCDFNNGIPDGFALYDRDGNTPSADAKKMGFEIGKPWISMGVMQDESDLSIVSTSSYSPLGTSNDWIITPAINIDSEYAYFSWVAANLTTKKDGYKILVSTKGQTVEDFADADVLYQTKTGEAQAGYIYPHMISLKKYANQTIYIAAVNNSTNQSFLMLDDFVVKEYFQSLDFINATTNVLNSDANTTIRCALLNSQPISFSGTDISVTLAIEGGETYTKDLGSLVIASGKNKIVSFTGIPAPAEGESTNYTLTLTYTAEPLGTIVRTINSALHRMGSTYSRKVVGEEATGTWCGWCPRGAVGMNNMKEKYPDDFIGIAVHNDIMQVDEYMNGIGGFISGFPSGVINRSSVVDPDFSKLEAQYKKEIVKPSIGSLSIVSADFGDVDSTAIRVKGSSSMAFSTNRAAQNFRYAFVVIENDVRGTTDDYNQANYYAGGRSGKMGGYESLSDPVPASQMVYQEVARGIASSFMGVEESLPTTVVKDQEFTFEYTFVTPKTITNKKNIEVIVLLVDQSTGEIWNADKIEAKDMGHDPSISEIETETIADNTIKVYAIDGELLVSLNSDTVSPARIEIYSLDGKKVKDAYFENVMDGMIIPVGDLKGIYVVKVKNGKNVAVEKVVLQ